MGKMSETWFTLRALTTSADGQSVSIVPEPFEATSSTGISCCKFATFARFCSFQFNKILFSLLLLGLIAALVALGEVHADLKSQIAKNSLASSQLRHESYRFRFSIRIFMGPISYIVNLCSRLYPSSPNGSLLRFWASGR